MRSALKPSYYSNVLPWCVLGVRVGINIRVKGALYDL